MQAGDKRCFFPTISISTMAPFEGDCSAEFMLQRLPSPGWGRDFSLELPEVSLALLSGVLRVGDGQGSLVFCSPWGHTELDMTE